MTPQSIFIGWLLFLSFTGILKVAFEASEDGPRAIGGALGIVLRYGSIAFIAWWGGFFQ